MLMYATKYKDRGILAAVSVDAGVKYNLPAKFGDVREHGHLSCVKLFKTLFNKLKALLKGVNNHENPHKFICIFACRHYPDWL